LRFVSFAFVCLLFTFSCPASFSPTFVII
jgi:hypothetical protein